MVFTLTSQMYYRILVLMPVLARVPEYLTTGTITSTGTITLELMEKWKILKKIYTLWNWMFWICVFLNDELEVRANFSKIVGIGKPF